MGRKPLTEIRLSAEEYRQLVELTSDTVNPARVRIRARILLMAAEHDENNHCGTRGRTYTNQSIADALGISKRTVITIRKYYINDGLERALFDKPRRDLPGIRLSTEGRRQLEELISEDDTPARIKRRALILLMVDECSDGSHSRTRPRMELNQAIVDAFHICLSTVIRIRRHYVKGGLEAALYDKPKSWRPEIRLSTEKFKQLEELISKDVKPARIKKRAQILLMAAEPSEKDRDGIRRRKNSYKYIADALQINLGTVIKTCKHFMNNGLEAALYDKARSVKIDEEAEMRLIVLARSAPPTGLKRWTLQLLADRMVELGYVDHISDTWVSMILKKTNCNYRSSKAGASGK